MKPSRRDSNRTQADMIRLLAVTGICLTEDEFTKSFKPEYVELARKIYREIQENKCQ